MPRKGKSYFATNLAVFILLEVAALCMVFLGNGSRQSAVGHLFTGIQAGLYSAVDFFDSYISLRSENSRLADENTRLQKRLRDVLEGQASKDSLSVMSDITLPRVKFSYKSATVVTMSLGSQHSYLLLDKGEQDGVEVNDGVITSIGVVGMVTQTTEHFAYAITYMNDRLVLSARLRRDGDIGTLRWDGHSDRRSILSDIPLQCTVNVGDTVYTSGFSTYFPGDIPLGVVESTKVDKGNSCEARIAMFENFHALRYVTIVKNLDLSEIEELNTTAQSYGN